MSETAQYLSPAALAQLRIKLIPRLERRAIRAAQIPERTAAAAPVAATPPRPTKRGTH